MGLSPWHIYMYMCMPENTTRPFPLWRTGSSYTTSTRARKHMYHAVLCTCIQGFIQDFLIGGGNVFSHASTNVGGLGASPLGKVLAWSMKSYSS